MKKYVRLVLLHLIFFVLILSKPGFCESSSGQGSEKDSVEQKRKGLFMLPIFFYTPETKIAGGAVAMYYFRESGSKLSSRPSSVLPSMIYTQNKQIAAELSTYLYWKDETYYSEGYLAFLKFPNKFYGIGNNTSEDDEEEYTPRLVRFKINLQRKVRPGFYLGLQYEFERRKLTEVEKDGMLERGDILGSQPGVGSGAGILASWDTRNSFYSPSTGGFHQFSVTLFKSALGSDYDFNRYTLDLRQYFPMFTSHVVAFQGFMSSITGDAPFQMLSLLGGQNLMRGHFEGRYRDKNMIVFQGEYRMPVWWRFGLAGFAGFGDVADKVSNFQISDFKYSLGAGVRYQISPEEGINLRLDFGFGEETSGLYITFNEAF